MLDSKVLYVGGYFRVMRMGQGIIVINYFKGCMKKVFVGGVLQDRFCFRRYLDGKSFCEKGNGD